MNATNKSILLRASVALALIIVLSSLAAGVALASSTPGAPIAINTSPIDPAEQVMYNPGSQPPVFHPIGTFPRYGAKYLTFTWKRYPFAADERGSYHISIMQNVTPLAAQPTWQEFMVTHAWADNPSGPTFTMGPFLRGSGLCDACPSMVVVSAETYQSTQSSAGDWQITYTSIITATPNPITGNTPHIVQESPLFVIQTSSQARCDAATGPDC